MNVWGFRSVRVQMRHAHVSPLMLEWILIATYHKNICIFDKSILIIYCYRKQTKKKFREKIQHKSSIHIQYLISHLIMKTVIWQSFKLNHNFARFILRNCICSGLKHIKNTIKKLGKIFFNYI